MSGEASGSRRVGIKSLVLLSIGSILFLFALVLGFYFYAAAIAPGQDTGSAKFFSPGEKNIFQIQNLFFEAQRNANLFLSSNDQTIADKQKTVVEELIALATQLKNSTSAGGDKAASATADKIIRQAQSYSRIFQHLVQAVLTRGTDPTKGLQGQINNAAKNFKNTVARNDAGNLAITLVSVKVQQKDFLRTKRKATMQNLLQATGKLVRLGREVKIDPLEAQLLRKSIKNYSSALDRYQAVSLATQDPNLSSTMGKETRRQVEAMETALEDIASIITRINIPGASDMAMDIRQFETDYIISGSEKSAASFEQSLSALQNIYTNSSILQEHKSEFSQTAAGYLESFKKLIENNKKIKDLTDEFNISSSSLSETLSAGAGQLTGTASRSGGIAAMGANNNLLIPIATIAGLVVILFGVIIALLLGRSLTTPITSTTTILQRIIRDKDFSIEIPISSNNEMGDLAFELNNLLILQKSLSQKTTEATSVLSESMDELRAYAKSLSGSIQIFSDTNSKIGDTADDKEEIKEQSTDSLKQLTQTAEGLAQNAKNAGSQSEQIAGATDKVSESLETTISAIKAITESSSQISEIITLSTDIAEQTNLLALNASVKAARAGSHGKEFAGIADEIAKLAQRAEEVAKEAGQLTKDLSAKVEDSVNLGGDSQKALANIQETGQANVETTTVLTSQAEKILTETQNLTNQVDTLSAVLQEIASLSHGQADEFNNAQDTVANLLTRTSGEQESLQYSEAEFHDDSREMRNHGIATSTETDAETESDEDEDTEYGDDTSEETTDEDVTPNAEESGLAEDESEEFSETEEESGFVDESDDYEGSEEELGYYTESDEYSEIDSEEESGYADESDDYEGTEEELGYYTESDEYSETESEKESGYVDESDDYEGAEEELGYYTESEEYSETDAGVDFDDDQEKTDR